MLKLAARYADGWTPPVPGVSMDVYRTVLNQFRTGSARKRTIKLTFNGTLDELSRSLPSFVEMGFDGAILARTPPETLTEAMRKLATDIARKYRAA
jgi:hypothetical protein